MSFPSDDRECGIFDIAHVENALFDGHTAQHIRGDTTNRSAARVAADNLGMAPPSMRTRIGTPKQGGFLYRKFGLLVDWGAFVDRTVVPPAGERALDQRRTKDDLSQLRKRVAELERELIAAADLRTAVGLAKDLPPQPVRFDKPVGGKQSAETVVLLLSDLQWGERVDIDAMDGLNSYNLRIAANRIGRWAAGVIELLTKHWSGPPPDRVIIILGGDLISGGIHLELAKTDELAPLPAVRDVAGHLRAVILLIKKAVACPVDIISIAGNHGRTTLKPESKLAASTSLDILVSDFLELALKDQAGISFYVPASPDALFSIYGWRILATHGDKIGTKGGHGFIGPAAPVARGMKKIIAEYANRGIHIDLILIGHFHTRLLLEEGFSNGCLPGPTEYSRDLRFRPAPAQQLFLCIHPRRLWTQFRMIDVGHPDEGSLYEPPPPDRPLRPRYRVKAMTQRT
jgi:hypothetical protein